MTLLLGGEEVVVAVCQPAGVLWRLPKLPFHPEFSLLLLQ
jgi:hypothetical protein